MKTHSINKFFKTLTLALILLLVSNNIVGQTPQCNVNINNTGNCTVVIQIDWYDSPTNICDTQTFSAIPNTPVNASCNCSNPVTNVRYSITGGILPVGGGGIGMVDVNNQNDSGSCSCPPLNTYSLTWAPGTLTIQ